MPASAAPARAVEIRNEFAAVEIVLDTAANGPRLHIRDLESGAEAFIDAFVLRSLALLPTEALEELCRRTVPSDDANGPAR